MNSFRLSREACCLCLILPMSALACGSETDSSSDGSPDEVSVLPGSACEYRADYSVADIAVTFPGKLNAADLIVISRWSNADASCPPEGVLSARDLGELDNVARWENGAVYVRPSEDLLFEMGVRVGVLMDCPEALFLGAEVRLDTARDGRGKLLAKCVQETF